MDAVLSCRAFYWHKQYKKINTVAGEGVCSWMRKRMTK